MTRLDEPHPAIDPLDEEFSLAPSVELSAERSVYVLREKFEPLVPCRPTRTQTELETARFSDPARFTLRNLLLVITLASVVLAVGIRFPRSYFAGAAGLAALVTALSATWLRHGSAVMQLAWWMLLGIYLMACGFAFLGM